MGFLKLESPRRPKDGIAKRYYSELNLTKFLELIRNSTKPEDKELYLRIKRPK